MRFNIPAASQNYHTDTGEYLSSVAIEAAKQMTDDEFEAEMPVSKDDPDYTFTWFTVAEWDAIQSARY